MRLAHFFRGRQVPYESLVHAPAFTSQRRARILRVPGRRVAKAVLVSGPAGLALAVVPATRVVDLTALGRLMGGGVELASVRLLPALFPDCEWGAVPPFGPAYGLATTLDDAFPQNGDVFCEGHTHAETLRITYADFESLLQPVLGAVSALVPPGGARHLSRVRRVS